MGNISRIVTLGPAGSWSEAATMQYLDKLGINPSVELVTPPNRTEGIIEYLSREFERGNYEVSGMVPIWNSAEDSGRVKETIGPKRGLRKYTNVQIYGEHVIEIEQILAANTDGMKKISIIASHPQGLMQCSRYLDGLKRSGHDITVSEAKSTSEAAEIAARDMEGRTAAICSPHAAELYGLRILERGIDRNDENGSSENKTRFVHLWYTDHEPTGKDKTTVTFEFAASQKPGQLYRATQIFAPKHPIRMAVDRILGEYSEPVNWSYVESMPSGSLLGYVFWVDLDDHREGMDRYMQRLQKLTNGLQVHGSYPRAYP